jgi:hypothetical protein
MAEHLGLPESAPLTTLQSKFEEAEVATGAIGNKTSAPNKPPVSNMQDPYGSQSLPIMPEVTEQSIAHGDEIAKAQKSNLVNIASVSDEQKIKNAQAMEEVFPSNLPGSNLSGMALESINNIINEKGTAEGKKFGAEMVQVLNQMLEGRQNQDLPNIRFDNTKTNTLLHLVFITRGQFIPDFERPTVLINPDFYLGENDIIDKPFPLTGNKERDVLMLVAMHELWHGTMEEALHAHESKTLRGEKSELQETIDLIDEVIRVAGEEAKGTEFSSLFLASNPNSRREILNRAWNSRGFAEFLAGIKVSKELQQRVDKNGQGFITSVLDALYGAYLKLLRALGIDADGSALKALLDLNRQMDAEYRKLSTRVVVNAFHGSKSARTIAIEGFDPAKLGSYTGAESAKLGFFFAKKIKTARKYSQTKGLLGRLIEKIGIYAEEPVQSNVAPIRESYDNYRNALSQNPEQKKGYDFVTSRLFEAGLIGNTGRLQLS